MLRFSNIQLPPLNAAVNVAGQTIRQFLPDRSNNQQQPSERVRFAQVNSVPNQSQNHNNTQSPEHHELSNMTSTNPFLSSAMKHQSLTDENCKPTGYQSTAFVEGQRPSMSSVDFSEGSDFVEGRSEVKINEYQAAWNVTNAIQVKINIEKNCLIQK